MSLWQLSYDLGAFPYTRISYLNIVRVLSPLAIILAISKAQLLFPPELTLLQTCLYINRGSLEIIIIVVHNWRLSKHSEDLERVLLVPKLKEIKLGKPVLITFFTNVPEFVFDIMITWFMSFDQPFNLGNFSLLILDNYVTLVCVQFRVILKHIKELITRETHFNHDVHKKANAVFDLIDTTRCVENLFKMQNFLIVVKVVVGSLYALFYFVIYANGPIWGRAYRIIFVGIQFVNLFYIVESSSDLRREVGRFNKELFRKMRMNPSLCADKRLKMYALAKRNVMFTGHKFFTLDFSLMQTAFGVAISYFIVLEQYKVITAWNPS